MPVSSVQNSERTGCSWGWTYMWNSDSSAPVEVFNRTAGNSTATNTEGEETKQPKHKARKVKTVHRNDTIFIWVPANSAYSIILVCIHTYR